MEAKEESEKLVEEAPSVPSILVSHKNSDPEEKKAEEPKAEAEEEEQPAKSEEPSKEPVHKEEEEQQQPKIEDLETINKEKQAKIFEKYLQSSGLSLAFEVIFAEILTKKIPQDQVFAYAAMRLRQFEDDLSKIESEKKAE